MARRTLLRLIETFPDVADKDNVYYHLFLINGRLNDMAEAEQYKQRLIEEFPDSRYAIMLANPKYELYARQGKHIEDSLYAATYEAYGKNEYEEVFRNYSISTSDFPEGAHRAKFMFIQAMSQLYGGERDSFLVTLKQVIEKYPGSEEARLAMRDLKSIYVDLNRIDEFAALANAMPGHIRFDANEQDSLTYAAAEKIYMRGRMEEAKTSLNKYLQTFPEGAFLSLIHI